jgi:sRNA-binding protein
MLDQKGVGPAAATTANEAQKVENNTGECCGPSSQPKSNAQVPSRAEIQAWRKAAFDTLLVLREKFPLAFYRLSARERRPLKVGIHLDLGAALPELGEGEVARALRFYVGDLRYHRACVDGAVRVGLDGEPAGVVTPEQAANSARSIKGIEAKIAQYRRGRAPPVPAQPAASTAPPPRLTLAALREAAAKRKLAAGGAS